MDERTENVINQLDSEKAALENIRKHLKKFITLKEEKASKNEIKDENELIEKLFNDNEFIESEWKLIKRSKASRLDGVEKLDREISDRKKKIEQIFECEMISVKTEDEKAHDWSDEIESCSEGSLFYHWAFGKMQVLCREGDYIYLKISDKKGCKASFLASDDAVVELAGKEEKTKQFSIYSIGKWLFPTSEDVKVIDTKNCHKIFAK